MSITTFTGQHVLVTGGSAGIGRAAALRFAEHGADRVTIVGRREEQLAAAAAEHSAIIPVVADLATADGVTAVVDAVAQHGPLNVLVHNAGVFRETPLPVADVAAVRDLLEVNVVAPIALTSRLLPHFGASGNIVFVTSISSRAAAARHSAYSASKSAVDALIRNWAVELAPRQLRVNGVAPGVVETSILQVGGLHADDVEAFRQAYAAVAPAQRIGQVNDVAPWITQLADPNSGWVTGEIIVVDGGKLLV